MRGQEKSGEERRDRRQHVRVREEGGWEKKGRDDVEWSRGRANVGRKLLRGCSPGNERSGPTLRLVCYRWSHQGPYGMRKLCFEPCSGLPYWKGCIRVAVCQGVILFKYLDLQD
ncbi:unnamed protein product [Calypogeia fissa]